MGLNIGSNSLSAAYVGGTEISKIYLGSTTVYEKSSGEYAGLCFTATADSSALKITNNGGNLPSLSYSLDNGSTWTSWDYSDIALNSGDTLCLKGTNVSTSSSSYSSLSASGSLNASGNIISLLDNGACTATTIPDYAFYGLFEMSSGIYDLSAVNIPNVTLGEYCCCNMFNASSVTKSPQLRPETLSVGAYSSMFMENTNINTIYFYANDTSATNCMTGFIKWGAESGDFYNYGSTGYCPSGWTLHTA